MLKLLTEITKILFGSRVFCILVKKKLLNFLEKSKAIMLALVTKNNKKVIIIENSKVSLKGKSLMI